MAATRLYNTAINDKAGNSAISLRSTPSATTLDTYCLSNRSDRIGSSGATSGKWDGRTAARLHPHVGMGTRGHRPPGRSQGMGFRSVTFGAPCGTDSSIGQNAVCNGDAVGKAAPGNRPLARITGKEFGRVMRGCGDSTDRKAAPLRQHPAWSQRSQSRDNVPQAEGERLLQLRVGARTWVAVGPRAVELRGMAESFTFHVVIAHLDHTLGLQRDE